jgi:hypothetical protein
LFAVAGTADRVPAYCNKKHVKRQGSPATIFRKSWHIVS